MGTNIEQKSNLAERRETFLERLADKVGSNVRASVVFGERIERDGVTIIPVAKAWWGFGGGGASPQAEGQEALGGGAGISVSPVGYIVVKEGKAYFRPIYDPRMIVPIIASLGIVSVMVLRGVRLLVRS